MVRGGGRVEIYHATHVEISSSHHEEEVIVSDREVDDDPSQAHERDSYRK
jgi:hypothetical protein